MTKEGYDIFWKEAQFLFDQHEMDITGLTNAADKYARVQSIEFAKWIPQNAYIKEDEYYFVLLENGEDVTFEQLYDLFIDKK